MINLLPPENKEGLKKEESFRLVLILGVLAIFFLLCLALLFLAIRIYVSGQIQAQNILVETERMQEEESPSQKIRNLNTNIGGVEAFYKNQIIFSNVMLDISSAAPQGIYLTSLSYAPDSSQRAGNAAPVTRISLSGFAPATEDLLAFRTNLEQNPWFTNVAIPPSNWVNPQNIYFSLDFEFQPPDP